jgi:hypothetical protein
MFSLNYWPEGQTGIEPALSAPEGTVVFATGESLMSHAVDAGEGARATRSVITLKLFTAALSTASLETFSRYTREYGQNV